jgi:chemosensory pili system protein ChpA (sensor histidine kinase/response regulator)
MVDQSSSIDSDVSAKDLGPLAWVLDETRKSIEAATKAFKRFAREAQSARGINLESVDVNSLRTARQQLHQVEGVLEMVGQSLSARLVRGMEGMVQRFVAKPQEIDQRAITALETAGFALVEYLQSFMNGQRCSALGLFAQYREVQELAGADRIHPADLWDFSWRWAAPYLPKNVKSINYAPDIRQRFDRGILGILRGNTAKVALDLHDLTLGLAAGEVQTKRAHPAAFWMLAAGFFQALSIGSIAFDVYAKRAVSRVLLQYITLVSGDGMISERLAHDLLFFCAQAIMPSDGQPLPALTSVRQAWGLTNYEPIDYNKPMFGLYDPSALTLAQRRVDAIKENWSALAGGDMMRLKACSEQLELVTQSLSSLLPKAQPLADELRAVMLQITHANRPPSPELAMETATAVLFLEASFADFHPADNTAGMRMEQLAQRLKLVREGAAAPVLEPWMEALYRQVSDRQTMGTVVSELRVTLSEMEGLLDQFFRRPSDRKPLENVPGLINQMRGVFSVLGLDQAVQTTIYIRKQIEAMLSSGTGLAENAEVTFNELGGNLGALGFLVDMLGYQPALARKLFVFDGASGQLKSLIGQVRDDQGSDADTDVDADSVADIEHTLEKTQLIIPEASGFVLDFDLSQPAGLPEPTAQKQADDVPSASIPLDFDLSEPGGLATVPASLDFDIDDDDEQDTKIEPQLDINPAVFSSSSAPPQALTKDSPALVGQLDQIAGRAALEEKPALAAAARQAIAAIQQNKPANLTAALQTVNLLRGSPPVPVQQTPVAPWVDTTKKAPTAKPAPVQQQAVDDDLLEIFLDEAREVIVGGQAAIEALKIASDDDEQKTTLRRAFHTLKGSSRMVGLAEFGEAAWAFEQVLNVWLAEQKPVDANLCKLASKALSALGLWVEDIAKHTSQEWTALPFRRSADALRLQGMYVQLEVKAPSKGAAAASKQDGSDHGDDEDDIGSLDFEVTQRTGLSDYVDASRAKDTPKAKKPQLDFPVLPTDLDSDLTLEQPTEAAPLGDREDAPIGFEVTHRAGLSERSDVSQAKKSKLPDLTPEPDSELSLELSSGDIPLVDEVVTPAQHESVPTLSVVEPANQRQIDKPHDRLPTKQVDGSIDAPIDKPIIVKSVASKPIDKPIERQLDRPIDKQSIESPDADDVSSSRNSTFAHLQDDSANLDFDWGLGDDDLTRPLSLDSQRATPSDSQAKQDTSNLLDIDWDVGAGTTSSKVQDKGVTGVPSAPSTSSTSSVPGITAKASVPETGPSTESESTLSSGALEFTEIDFSDFEQAGGQIKPPPAQPVAPGAEIDLNLGDPVLPKKQAPIEQTQVVSKQAPDSAKPAPTQEPVQEKPKLVPTQQLPKPYTQVGDLRMSVELYEVYIEEAQSWSKELIDELTRWGKAMQQPVPENAVMRAHSLAGSSATVGFMALSALARGVEHALMRLREQHGIRPGQLHTLDQAAEAINDSLSRFASGVLQPPSKSVLEAVNAIDSVARPAPPKADPVKTTFTIPRFGTSSTVVTPGALAPIQLNSMESPPSRTPTAASSAPKDATAGPSTVSAKEPAAPLSTQPSAAIPVQKEIAGAPSTVSAKAPIEASADPNDTYTPTPAAPSSEQQAAQPLAPAQQKDAAAMPSTESSTPAPATAPPAPTASVRVLTGSKAAVSAMALAPVAISTIQPIVRITTPSVPVTVKNVPKYAVADNIDATDAIDADLFPVFEEETEELLPKLQSGLREWMDNPDDNDLRKQVKRFLHTLKGSARLAGALRLGEMAHRAEAAIEMLGAEGLTAAKLGTIQDHVDVIEAAFSRLVDRQIRGVEDSQLPSSIMGDVYEAPQFTDFNTLSDPQPEQPSAKQFVPGPITTRPPQPKQAPTNLSAPTGFQTGQWQSSGRPPLMVDTSSIDSPQKTVFTPLETDGVVPAKPVVKLPVTEPPVSKQDPAQQPQTPEIAPPAPLLQIQVPVVSNQVVRIKTQLLDRMVNQAGEVMTARSRLEGEVMQLRAALSELSNNLARLRTQLRDVELQAELQIQSRMAHQTKEEKHNFDPLEFDRFTRMQELTRMMAESVNDVATVQRTLQRAIEAGEDDLAEQARQTRELQHGLLRTRMVEFESIVERLYRVVRQTSKESDKLVRLDIVGGSIEIDRGILERMIAPFEHLLRNCVVHGIEPAPIRLQRGKSSTGVITIEVQQSGNDVSITFHDDGGGLDLQRLRAIAESKGLIEPGKLNTEQDLTNLVFVSGLTTVKKATELAGRGVGMDVVRTEVQSLGGRIETHTEAERGTSFKLVLPLTTAVTQVVMLRMDQIRIGVPSSLVEIVRLATPAELKQAYNCGTYTYGTEELPFFWGGSLLQNTPSNLDATTQTTPVIVMRSASQRLAMHVNEVVGNQEVVVKALGPQLSRLPGLVAITVLASGDVTLIYNPVALAAVYGQQARTLTAKVLQAKSSDDVAPTPLIDPSLPPLILVVDDSITVRRVAQRMLQREGYRVALASDGLQGIDQLRQERPAVVLTDIEMPHMDGFDFVRNLRADPRWSDLPVIMITSRIAEKHREQARTLNVDHYLGKPYSEEQLLELVGKYAQTHVEA